MPLSPNERRLGKTLLQKRVPAVEIGAVGAALGHLRLDRRDDVAGVGDRDRPDVHQPIRQRDRLHQRMPVRLDQSGQHAAVADVEDLGVGPDERIDVGVAADVDYPTVGHGQRFGGGS